MQQDLHLQSPADFSLPLSVGQVRVRALAPAWTEELGAVAADSRLDDSVVVREALKKASAEDRGEAERLARALTDEDVERLAEKFVDHHPWILEGGPGGSKMVRRFDHETHAAHFRRALMWHRANKERAPVTLSPELDTEPAIESSAPAKAASAPHWALIAAVALSAAAAALAGLSWFDGRTRAARVEREQRNAFDALQQQLNANNDELRRLRQELQPPKPPAPPPEARKAPPSEPKKSARTSRKTTPREKKK